MKKPYGLTSPVEPSGQAARAGELQALLARVEAATGANYELEKALWYKLIFDPALDRKDDSYLKLVGTGFPPYTASLDAALALTERVLPGWEIRATLHDPHVRVNNRSYTVDVGALGRTPALALLAAMLKALLSSEAQPSVCEQGEQGNPVEDEPNPHPDTREGEG